MTRSSRPHDRGLWEAVDQHLPLAEGLLSDLRKRTADGIGVTRASYGAGEQVAHDLLSEVAQSLDLEITEDAARNLYMTVPGVRRDAPSWMTGSHLDSVAHGGNYDGAAGVVAGITVLAALQRSNVKPARDVTVMAIRAEEAGSWFKGKHNSVIGSRAALGTLDADELESATCVNTGRTLAERMREAGADPEALMAKPAHLAPVRIKGFVELHIEQGPVLEAEGVPVGIVTAIRGGLCARECICIGSYTHAGAVPRRYRRDAVMAVSELISTCDRLWDEIEGKGGDLVFTVGKLHTDQEVNSLTKVPGEARFCLDIRSQDLTTLEHVTSRLEEICRAIAERRGIEFQLGPLSLNGPTAMDEALRRDMRVGCGEIGIPAMDLPSGGGHDAAEFAKVGIPSAMIFVRNQHGSHNPEERMEMADFALGTKLLAWMVTG